MRRISESLRNSIPLQSGMKYDAEEYIDHLGRLLDGNIRHTLEHSCRAAGQSDT